MRLLVLSRNAQLYSTTRLVLAARSRGHTVDVIDPLTVQLVITRGGTTLLVAGRRMPTYDVVIPRIGASITHYGLAVVRQLEEQGVSILNDSEAIGLSRDKLKALQALAKCGLPVPRTVCARSPVGLDKAIERVGGCPVIIKLQQGTQGIGIMIAESAQAAHSLLETLWAMGQEIVIQEYLREAKGVDLRAFVVDGRVVAAMRRIAKPGDFRSNLHRGGTGNRATLSARETRVASAAASVVGLDVAGVDIIETSRGPRVVEVNSSPGLEGIERASGVDVAGEIVGLAEARSKRRRRSRRANG